MRSDVIVTYDTLDKGPVIVSSVTESPTDSGTIWKDIIFVGEVTNFIASKKINILKPHIKGINHEKQIKHYLLYFFK